MDIKNVSWVKRGKQRREIIIHISGQETPTEIAKKSGYSLNNTSRVLHDLTKKGLAKKSASSGIHRDHRCRGRISYSVIYLSKKSRECS